MFADVPPEQRLQVLRDNCDSMEETSYTKDLTQYELDVKQETIAANCINVFQLEEDKKKAIQVFKDQIDPLKEETRELCGQVKNRKEEVKGKLFHFADHETSIMNTYDEMGEFVASRRLKPEEKQARLFIAPGGKVASGE